jgi:hypothetical protein
MTTLELREYIYARILRSGAAGLTDEELSQSLDVAGDVARHRRHELVQFGLIVNSGIRRPTRRGHTASVWMSGNVAKKTGRI